MAGRDVGGGLESVLKRPFYLLWLAESAFDCGAALMTFALGVWVFDHTGSAEQFVWTVLASTVPALLLTPVAGALADRVDRRMVIAACDGVVALLVLWLALLYARGSLEVVHLYIFNAMTASAGALRNPAFKAVISLLVPKDQMTRANGFIGLSEAMFQVVAPLVAGYAMASAGLGSVLVIEVALVVAGALAAFTALSSVDRAVRRSTTSASPDLVRALSASLASAIDYFKRHPLMVALLAYTVLQESLLALISAMITPLVLSTHSADTLGWVLTSGALGAVAGAGLMVLYKVQHHLMTWVLVTDACLSLAVAAAGFSQNVWVWCLCAFVGMGAGSASGICAGALWMRKTPADRLGGVFASVEALHLLATCVVLVTAGVVGERWLEPALLPGGAWSESLGPVIGTGQGRGFGLLFAVSGLVCLLASLLALSLRPMRQLDQRVADRPDAADPTDPEYRPAFDRDPLSSADRVERREA